MTGAVPLWCFAGADVWALTDDQTGAALPDDLGPWILRKGLTIDGINPEEAEALRLIDEHGFCCFDPIPADADT